MDKFRCFILSKLSINCILDRDAKKTESREQHHPVTASAPVIHHQVPAILYQGSPTITAMQVRKEKEAELFANDQYWANRLEHQEREFLKNNKIMEQEFDQAVSSKTHTPVAGCP